MFEQVREVRNLTNLLCAKIEESIESLLGMPMDDLAKRRIRLPGAFGGCGLRSARRTRVAAYRASWADTLPMMEERCPRLAKNFAQELEAGNSRARSLRALPRNSSGRLVSSSSLGLFFWSVCFFCAMTFKVEYDVSSIDHRRF